MWEFRVGVNAYTNPNHLKESPSNQSEARIPDSSYGNNPRGPGSGLAPHNIRAAVIPRRGSPKPVIGNVTRIDAPLAVTPGRVDDSRAVALSRVYTKRGAPPYKVNV